MLTTLFLVSCAGQPTKTEINKANYGKKPVNYENLVKEKMKDTLKDPDSAKYKFNREPSKMWIVNPYGDGHLFGWGTCGEINAKNSYGGYTGFQRYFYFFQENKMVYSQRDEMNIYCSNGFNEVE